MTQSIAASSGEDRVRDLTESGDFYSATPAAWERYRAAVNAGDWDEVMRHETGQYGDFRYAP